MGEPDLPESIDTSTFQPCSNCGRTFRPDALARHEEICQKTSKKRKVFDSSKQRAAQNGDAPPPAPVDDKDKNIKPKPKSNWREKHQQLIQTVKASRVGNKPEENVTGTNQRKIPSDYVKCPTCNRHFNQKAADRHISWCQEHHAQTPKAYVNNEAQEKLKARTKYKVPPPGRKGGSGSKPLSTRSAIVVDDGHKAHRKTVVAPPHSSPASLTDARKNREIGSKESVRSEGSQRGKARDCCGWKDNHANQLYGTPQQHVIKFKEKFPGHINKRGFDLDETYQADQWRELLQTDKTSERKSPRTVPGLRVPGYHATSNLELTGSWVSSSWPKTIEENGLPEVSSSEEPILRSKNNWNGDPDASFSSSDSSNNSLPPFSRESADSPQPRFCHQCGSKFPIANAKYCCECGAKRRTFGITSSSPSG